MSGDGVEVEVYDKTLTRVGWLGEYASLVTHPRHNTQPTASLTIGADNEYAADLSEPGARLLVRYRDEHLLSGPLRLSEVDGVGPGRSLTFQVEDDWRLLRRLLAWQVPTATTSGQGAAAYKVYSGPAESVVKAIVSDNLARLGAAMRPAVTVAPDQGRGATITVQVRMHLIADRIFPLVDQAGIGVTVQQVGAGLVVDCYEPTSWPITLSEDAGTLTDVSWSRRAPEVTRVVVAIGGEGTARQYYGPFIDAAAEAEWGDVIERLVDARDIAVDDPNRATLAAARAAEALAEGAAGYGLGLSLSETETFRYGGTDGVHVGDVVTVDLAGGVTVTDVVRSATVTHSADNGLTVTPVVGERTDPDAVMARAVGAAFKGLRELRAGE